MNEPADKTAIMKQAQATAPASEATQIEQSRAIAQVQGALVVAQQRPRDEMAVVARIREACAIPQLADRAFFRFPRGGQQITGPSIHLAAELARCFGNVEFGIVELRRDDRKAESEMLAVAWDLETNTRVTNSFIVPHKRDKKGGPEALTDMRDIYENNANQGARRLRECIFRILPVYVVEDAKTMCMETLGHGGGEPIAKRAEKMLAAFGEIGITRQQVEKRLGVAITKISAVDIANLGIMFQSIKRGEVRADDEFPPDRAKAISDDLKAADEKTPSADTTDKPETENARAGASVGDDGASEDEWAAVAQEMIERIDEAGSAKHLEAVLAARRFDELARMETAAPQQYRAVTGFIDEKREALSG